MNGCRVDRHPSIKIAPLDWDNLQEAAQLVRSVLPWQGWERVEWAFPLSLHLERYRHVQQTIDAGTSSVISGTEGGADIPWPYSWLLRWGQIEALRFWVGLDSLSARIIATTGLYCHIGESHSQCWLGWFCVHPDYRRRGIGTALLNFTIEQARLDGRKAIRLYTSTHPLEQSAQTFYQNHKFVLIQAKPYFHWGILPTPYRLLIRERSL